MAKRRDMMEQAAKDRTAGAEIATLSFIKSFTVSLASLDEQSRENVHRLKDSQGRVYRQVQVLHCRATFSGLAEPVAAEIEMEALPNWGATGELEQCIVPAFQEFIKQAKAKILGAKVAADQPLGDGPAPLPSERPLVSEVHKERGRALHAADEAGRRAKNQPTTPPPEQFADEKGGEA